MHVCLNCTFNRGSELVSSGCRTPAGSTGARDSPSGWPTCESPGTKHTLLLVLPPVYSTSLTRALFFPRSRSLLMRKSLFKHLTERGIQVRAQRRPRVLQLKEWERSGEKVGAVYVDADVSSGSRSTFGCSMMRRTSRGPLTWEPQG